MRSFDWALVQFDWHPFVKGKIRHDIQGSHHGKMKQRLRRCIYKSRSNNIASNHQKMGERPKQILLHCPQKEPMLTTLGSQTSSFQNGEAINFCCVGHQLVVCCYSSPSRLMQRGCSYEKWQDQSMTMRGHWRRESIDSMELRGQGVGGIHLYAYRNL